MSAETSDKQNPGPGGESPDMTPQQTGQSSQLPAEGDPDKADRQPEEPTGQSSDAPVTG